MQSILNMSAPRSGKLYKEKAPRAECFFWLVAPKKISPQRRIICPRIMLIEKLDSDQNVSFVVLSIKLVFLIPQPFPHRYPR